MARKRFEETFTAIFKEAQENPDLYDGLLDETIDLDDPKGFATKLEEEMFAAWATPKKDSKDVMECGEPVSIIVDHKFT